MHTTFLTQDPGVPLEEVPMVPPPAHLLHPPLPFRNVVGETVICGMLAVRERQDPEGSRPVRRRRPRLVCSAKDRGARQWHGARIGNPGRTSERAVTIVGEISRQKTRHQGARANPECVEELDPFKNLQELLAHGTLGEKRCEEVGDPVKTPRPRVEDLVPPSVWLSFHNES